MSLSTCLLIRREKIKDCEVKIESGKNSDHYPIYAEVRTNMKLAGRERQSKEGAKKYWKPDDEKKMGNNRRICELLWEK